MKLFNVRIDYDEANLTETFQIKANSIHLVLEELVNNELIDLDTSSLNITFHSIFSE